MSTDQPSQPQPVPTAQVVAAQAPHREPRRIILEQPMAFGRKLAMFGLLTALGISVMFNLGLFAAFGSYVNDDPSITEHLHSGSAMARDKIAVIRVRGAIMEGEGFAKRQIDRVAKDDAVKGIVLRVDSPGGTVAASHYLYHHLKQLAEKKQVPMVVSMGSLAASGGYYISMAVGDAEDAIFAEPTTWTGSIGVIIPNYDLSALMEQWNIEDRSFTSGPYKQLGTPTRAMDDDDKAVMQALVDESFEDFKDIVKSGRPKLAEDEATLAKATTGQIFTAKQALELGLVDKLGFIEDAVARVKDLAGLDTDNDDAVRVVEYRRPRGLLETALSGQAQALSAPQWQLESLLNLATPRAYYLFTTVPALAIGQAR
ncbi:MAG: signal peptide peptidase SppA [Planctomycetota bacterium]|nr:MAG: signal peptide peptidase SppA [Planctomycetota bacterium]REJ92752.1 MAG: signal peptide peptidase SppA [Planctomycetota bacterium]